MLAIFGLFYGLFCPFLTLFNTKKTSFLVLLGKKFPEKLSGLSVKGGGYPPFPLRKKTFFFAPKTLFFAFFYAFLALFGTLYGLFGPFLTLSNEKKTSFLALLGKKFPEKLSGLSVKGGGYPPFPLRVFLGK